MQKPCSVAVAGPSCKLRVRPGVADGIITYVQTQPSSPNRRRPQGAFFPAPVGAGSAPTPERARLALGTLKKSLAPCPLRSTPSAGRCTCQLASLWSSERWRSLGPVSFGFGAASPRYHPGCLCPAPWPWQAGGSRTFRLTRAQPVSALPNSPPKASPRPNPLNGS